MGKKTSIYLPDDLDEAIRAAGQSIPDLIRLGLESAGRARTDQLTAEGYVFVPPADNKAELAAELAELASRMSKLAGQSGS